MKNIIPFRKNVIFKTNLSEITSISLENTLNIKLTPVNNNGEELLLAILGKGSEQ